MLRRPFDPLGFLEDELRLEAILDPRGSIILKGMGSLAPRNRKRAKWELDTYDKLLRLQLDAPKREMWPSVRKLQAQGKIVIRGGKYMMP